MKETNEKWKRVFFDFHLIENIMQYVRNETKTWFDNGLLPLFGISILVSYILYPILACTVHSDNNISFSVFVMGMLNTHITDCT